MSCRAGALAVALAAVATIAAQDRPPQPIRSEANFVRVDVHPSSAGRPVVDLLAGDFEVLEDGVPQKIETFDLFTRGSASPASLAAEPGSLASSRDAVARARGNVFVLFLDAAHVSSTASQRIAEPLARLLERIVGPEDLIGVMTSEMAATQVVFGRKTDVIRRGLLTNGEWGRRFERTKFDEREHLYDMCYPLLDSELKRGRMISKVAQELVDRRREKMTFDAFTGLIELARATTQARTTVLTVTEGWLLFQPNRSMLEPRIYDEDNPRGAPVERAPGGEHVRITPGGRLGVGDKTDLASMKYACDTDKIELSAIDDRQRFRDLMGTANRNNVAFYTIDPRGLTPFDTDIRSDPPDDRLMTPLDWDHASLSTRQGTMRDLANNTDGLAVMNSLEFDRNLRRIVDDLSSYYLLGYYSTNAKLDGKYREIEVRVKRPGVDVRARRGYRAPTSAEVAARAGAPAAEGPKAEPSAEPLPRPALFHRGPGTGNTLQPLEAPTLSRTERLHVEVRLERGMQQPSARLLGPTGQPLAIPVITTERIDARGRWLLADVTLAPLAPGNYAIELSASDTAGLHKVVTPIRVVR
jgi:VWFA-related protein